VKNGKEIEKKERKKERKGKGAGMDGNEKHE
jgi:hypothetical protein